MQFIHTVLIISLLFSATACSTTSKISEKNGDNKKERYSQNERFNGRFDR